MLYCDIEVESSGVPVVLRAVPDVASVVVLVGELVPPVIMLVVMLIVVVEVVVPIGYPVAMVVVVGDVWDSVEGPPFPGCGIPLDGAVVNTTPNDEVTVGGDPPAVDNVFELAGRLRAMRQSAKRK